MRPLSSGTGQRPSRTSAHPHHQPDGVVRRRLDQRRGARRDPPCRRRVEPAWRDVAALYQDRPAEARRLGDAVADWPRWRRGSSPTMAVCIWVTPTACAARRNGIPPISPAGSDSTPRRAARTSSRPSRSPPLLLGAAAAAPGTAAAECRVRSRAPSMSVRRADGQGHSRRGDPQRRAELLPESLATAIIPLQMRLVYRIGQS